MQVKISGMSMDGVADGWWMGTMVLGLAVDGIVWLAGVYLVQYLLFPFILWPDIEMSYSKYFRYLIVINGLCI